MAGRGFWLINQLEYPGASDVATLMMVCQGVARPLSAPNTSQGCKHARSFTVPRPVSGGRHGGGSTHRFPDCCVRGKWRVGPPLSASEAKGKKYQDVVTRFENAGFTNVTTEAVADLVIGLFAGDGEVKDVSIAGDSDYTKNEKFAPDAPVVIRYHTFPAKESATPEAAETPTDQPSPSSSPQSSTPPTPEEVLSAPEATSMPGNLTVENNSDLAALLSLKDPADPSVAAFASKYQGRIIEFDGCVVAVSQHGSTKTRFDYLLSAGNFDPDSAVGPNFQFFDINYYDFHFPADKSPDSVPVGTNLRIIAEVGKYDSKTNLFQLRPVKTSMR